MDHITFAEYLLKELRAEIAVRSERLVDGNVSDWSSYQRMVGEITGRSSAEMLIVDLLKNLEKVEND